MPRTNSKSRMRYQPGGNVSVRLDRAPCTTHEAKMGTMSRNYCPKGQGHNGETPYGRTPFCQLPTCSQLPSFQEGFDCSIKGALAVKGTQSHSEYIILLAFTTSFSIAVGQLVFLWNLWRGDNARDSTAQRSNGNR